MLALMRTVAQCRVDRICGLEILQVLQTSKQNTIIHSRNLGFLLGSQQEATRVEYTTICRKISLKVQHAILLNKDYIFVERFG